MTLAIAAIAEQVPPASVVPRATAIVAERANVEASDLAVVAGTARVTVRFTGEDDAEATVVAGYTLTRVAGWATVSSCRITRRDGGRWTAV